MQISLEKFSLFLTGVATVGLVIATGYFFYLVFFTGPEPEISPSLSSASVGVFGPNIQEAMKALTASEFKIELDKKNIAFASSSLFGSFTQKPGDILPSDVRGRENPFVPFYAAP